MELIKNKLDAKEDYLAGKKSESDLVISVLQKTVKYWMLFVIVGFIGAVIGFMYATKQQPLYQSYLSFALDEGGSEGGGSSAMSLAAQFGISLGGSQNVFTGDNIIEIMQSRRMIERALLAVDTFDNKPMTLIEYYLENEVKNDERKKRITNIHFYPTESRKSFSYIKDSVLYNTFLAFKRDHIIARRPDKRLNIYELMVSSHNEKFSKIFTDKLIDETNRFYTEIRSKKAKETLEILEKRVPDMKGKLDAAINSKAAIQDANLNTAFANAQVPLIKEQSNAQVYGTAYAEMFKNLEIARFQYLNSIPLMQIIDTAEYPLLKIKPGKLKTSIIFSIASILICIVIFVFIQLFLSIKNNNLKS